jgi:hypothetical protein
MALEQAPAYFGRLANDVAMSRARPNASVQRILPDCLVSVINA